MIFVHSILRYAVLFAVLIAFLVNLRGWLMSRPIIVWERSATIIAMVLCHVQLVVGLALYGMNAKAFHDDDAGAWQRFILHAHIGSMVLAIALITGGRMMSKRSNDERRKQMLIALTYGAGLLLMLYATPWPVTEIGRLFAKGWL